MAMDLAKMLQIAIQAKNRIWDEYDVAMPPEEGLRRTYVVADDAIAKLVDVVGWNKIPVPKVVQRDQILSAYVLVLDAFFQIAAMQTWSHLMVMSPNDQAELMQKRPAKSLNQQVLALRQFLLKSYFERQQNAFEHAWHLVLKWGWVDLKLTDEEIEARFLAQNHGSAEQ